MKVWPAGQDIVLKKITTLFWLLRRTGPPLSMSIRNEGGRDRQKLRTVIYNELKCIDIMYGRQKFVAFRGEKRYIIAIEDYEV